MKQFLRNFWRTSVPNQLCYRVLINGQGLIVFNGQMTLRSMIRQSFECDYQIINANTGNQLDPIEIGRNGLVPPTRCNILTLRFNPQEPWMIGPNLQKILFNGTFEGSVLTSYNLMLFIKGESGISKKYRIRLEPN